MKEKENERMTRRAITEELRARGYEIEIKEVEKNGVVLHGIVFLDDEEISPIIYMENIMESAEIKGLNKMEVVDEVIKIYESNKGKIGKDILRRLTDPQWVLDHIQIAVQKESTQDIMKKELKDFEGIEAYLTIMFGSDDAYCSNICLNKEQLSSFGSTEELWKKAYQNLCNNTYIEGMTKALNGLNGMQEKEEENEQMYIVSNKNRIKGAGAILNRKALKELAERRGVHKIFVFPSSIHEMLVLIDDGSYTLDALSSLVTEINADHVAPEEQLTNRAYVLEF